MEKLPSGLSAVQAMRLMVMYHSMCSRRCLQTEAHTKQGDVLIGRGQRSQRPTGADLISCRSHASEFTDALFAGTPWSRRTRTDRTGNSRPAPWVLGKCGFCECSNYCCFVVSLLF